METEQLIGLILALAVMATGCVGCALPGIPGTPLVLIAAVVHKFWFRETGAGWITLTALVLMTAFALVLDYLATMYGAKRFGATRKGMIGAIVGGVIGLFFNLVGILIGPFLGAVVFEMIGGRKFDEASRAGVGATIGLFAGALGKIFCCLAMIFLFTANVLWRTLHQ